MSLPNVPDSFKPKTFWEKPEGNSGMLFIGGLCLAGFFLGQAILPAILGFLTMGIAVVGKGIILAALCAFLAAFLGIVTNKKFITLVGYMFKSVMRSITQLFVDIDPIGIMRNYIDNMKVWANDLDISINKLNGQKKILENTIRDNDNKYTNAMNLTKLAKANGNNAVLAVQSRQAGRLEQVNEQSYKPLLSTMNAHLSTLKKFREVSETVIADLTNEVEVKSVQRNMILASHSAIKSAMKIIRGDQDKKELFDQAMEYVVNDYGIKLGEIEMFIDTSKGFIDGLDMQNGVFEADALEKLQAWENKADSILLGSK